MGHLVAGVSLGPLPSPPPNLPPPEPSGSRLTRRNCAVVPRVTSQLTGTQHHKGPTIQFLPLQRPRHNTHIRMPLSVLIKCFQSSIIGKFHRLCANNAADSTLKLTNAASRAAIHCCRLSTTSHVDSLLKLYGIC